MTCSNRPRCLALTPARSSLESHVWLDRSHSMLALLPFLGTSCQAGARKEERSGTGSAQRTEGRSPTDTLGPDMVDLISRASSGGWRASATYEAAGMRPQWAGWVEARRGQWPISEKMSQVAGIRVSLSYFTQEGECLESCLGDGLMWFKERQRGRLERPATTTSRAPDLAATHSPAISGSFRYG